MKKVAVVPGLAEGDGQMREFISELKRHGFKIAEKNDISDVVIAHSAGCYFIPKIKDGGLLIFINPSYGMGMSNLRRQVGGLLMGAAQQIKDWGLVNWLKIRFLNCFYILSQPRRTLEIFNRARIDRIVIQPGIKVLLIRNTGDLSQSNALKLLGAATDYKEIPGLHEDCWIRPKPYIDLLLKEL